MRDLKTFFKDIITQPPVLFPLAALFHIVLLLVTLWALIKAPGTSTEVNVLWMLGYATCWLAVADMRKWGAIGYIIITVTSILVNFSSKSSMAILEYGSPIFITDVLFCFFIMFYFKRFR